MAEDPDIRNTARRIREQQKSLDRFERLELTLKYLREHGGEIQPVIRFGASAVHGHDVAAEEVKAIMFGDWTESGRRQVQDAIAAEMAQIKEDLK